MSERITLCAVPGWIALPVLAACGGGEAHHETSAPQVATEAPMSASQTPEAGAGAAPPAGPTPNQRPPEGPMQRGVGTPVQGSSATTTAQTEPDSSPIPDDVPAETDSDPTPQSPSATGSPPPCISDRLQGVFIGDSYVTGFQSPALQPVVDVLLAEAGLVTDYPNYAFAGAAMASGGISEPDLIPYQFDRAEAASTDIRLAIMDGGGNDWLLPAPGKPDCKNMDDPGADTACRDLIAEVMATQDELFQRMADHGVKDVIFFGLPHFQPGGFNGLVGSNPNAMIDLVHVEQKAACEKIFAQTGKLACHYIDLREFHDLTDFTHVVDGSHPSQSAQENLAREIFTIMQDRCLGQPEASGCCAP
ncbi:MAG: hypothetical protein OXR73_26975 [Myxococcales bacterium]|nr:hypothetical protein [Myxococcales bacterium]